MWNQSARFFCPALYLKKNNTSICPMSNALSNIVQCIYLNESPFKDEYFLVQFNKIRTETRKLEPKITLVTLLMECAEPPCLLLEADVTNVFLTLAPAILHQNKQIRSSFCSSRDGEDSEHDKKCICYNFVREFFGIRLFNRTVPLRSAPLLVWIPATPLRSWCERGLRVGQRTDRIKLVCSFFFFQRCRLKENELREYTAFVRIGFAIVMATFGSNFIDKYVIKFSHALQ